MYNFVILINRLSINTFTKDARSAEISVAPDSHEGQKMEQKLKRWDRKKKKMVSVQDKRVGKILTEHGSWIPASYKTNRYEKWKDKTKIEEQLEREHNSDDEAPVKQMCKYDKNIVILLERYKISLV
jgi:ATP-dependent RNA helicase DDX54/DBP10